MVHLQGKGRGILKLGEMVARKAMPQAALRPWPDSSELACGIQLEANIGRSNSTLTPFDPREPDFEIRQNCQQPATGGFGVGVGNLKEAR